MIDLRPLAFMDSTGLAVLASHTRERERERRLVIIRGPRQLDRLLEITGLGQPAGTTDPTPIGAASPCTTAPTAA